MKTILIADDEPTLRVLVRTTLEDPRFRILEASDGTAALDLARTQHPDLVLLDWRMPGIPGIEVAESLGKDTVTADIPVIMLTAMGQEWSKERGHAAGVYAYLVKPFSPLQLLDMVEEALFHQHRFEELIDD